LLSTPVCSNDTLITKYLPGDSHNPANRAWTRAASCTANGTAEYCIFVSSTFANGRGIAVLTSPDRADFIANLPGFADPEALAHENVDEDPELSKFKMVHVPGKDMGVVATQPFQRGDHIMTFTPAIIIDYAMFDDLPEADMHRLQAEAVDYLPSELRGRFLNLSTHDGASGYVERVEKILRTNAFDVEVEDENTNGLYVVFPESRSWSPNPVFSPVANQRKQSPGSTMTAGRTQITTSIRRHWHNTSTPRGPSRSGRRSVSPTWSKLALPINT
jgi:hypothetical protein